MSPKLRKQLNRNKARNALHAQWLCGARNPITKPHCPQFNCTPRKGLTA